MALGDALHSLIVTAGRNEIRVNCNGTADFTYDATADFGAGAVSNCFCLLENMIFMSKLVFMWDQATIGFIEGYTSLSDESSHVFSIPILTHGTAWTLTEHNFHQPLRVNSVYIGIRAAEPYPDARDGANALTPISAQEIYLSVMQTPRNATG